MTKEELEGYLAEGLSLEQIGERVGRHPSTISYHLKKHGLRPVNQKRHLRRGPIPEQKLRELHARGASLREIADAFDRGVNTTRYWISKYGLWANHWRFATSCDQYCPARGGRRP